MNKSDLFFSAVKNRKIMVRAFLQHGAPFCDFGATWFYSDYDFGVKWSKRKGQPGEKLTLLFVKHNVKRHRLLYDLQMRI